ncbi:MAG TPA: glycosyltransferase 87 family protein [Silvibacterium sp.]|nr:glycosyltransferase 87 family protein [Silvibacterium sp.]
MISRLQQWLLSSSAIALILAIGCITAFTLSVPARDSLSYWTAGRQLLHRANPYAFSAVDRLESAAGFHGATGSLVMLNPPSALPLTLPFGPFGPRLAGLLWSLALLGCLVASVRMVRTIHGSPKNYLHLLGYFFGPAVVCVFAGQIPLFALLGLAIFLRLQRTRPFAAGAALCLCAVKPHLFLPFGLVLLAWTIATRRYRIILGAAAAFAATNALVLLLDPAVWTHYSQLMLTLAPRIAKEFIPCVSVVLRRSVDPHALWLQGVPEALGCVWAIAYFWKHRRDWDWMEHGSLLMLVSVFIAPYTWLVDQSVLVPAMLHAVYRAPGRVCAKLLGWASVIIILQIILGADVRSPWNLWPTPFWIALYLWATKYSDAANELPQSVNEEEASLANI